LDNTENTRFLKTAVKAANDKFGEDITALNIGGVSTLADYFVIVTGRNANQIKAIADEIDRKLREEGLDARHIEGYNGANWVLMDYGLMIIHIFDAENRNFYSIERLWGDAETIDAATL
jgi:ribosome-associated protein